MIKGSLTCVFNSDYQMTSAVEVGNMATPLQGALFKILGLWKTGDYRALCRCYADNAEVFWTDTRTGETKTATGYEDMVGLWEYVMALNTNPYEIKIDFDFNEKDRVVTATFSWENSNFLNGSHVLVFDENFNVVRSNIVATSQPGRVEGAHNLMLSHWMCGDLVGLNTVWAPSCSFTEHNSKTRKTIVLRGVEDCGNHQVYVSNKMEDKSDFQILDTKFDEEMGQVFVVSTCLASGVNHWAATFTYNCDNKVTSLVVVTDRDW